MSFAHIFRLGALLGLWLLSYGLLSGQTRFGPFTAPNSGITMDLQLYYDNLPPSGMIPLRLIITNETDRDLSWQLTTESSLRYSRHSSVHTKRASFALPVPAGSTRRFELLAPLHLNDHQSHRFGSSLSLNISGYGIRSEEMPLRHYAHDGDISNGFVGLSSNLGRATFSSLQEEMLRTPRGARGRGRSTELAGTLLPIMFPAFPADWRGMSGFSLIILKGSDWLDLGDPERAAVRRWVMHGGDLILIHPEGESPLMPGLPTELAADGRHPLGHGHLIHRFSADGQAVVGELVADVELARPFSDRFASGRTLDQWTARRDLDRGLPGSTLMILFVFLFGLVIGPINLFVFARQKKRARILWTTPLISLIGCLVLLLMILLLEGTGGTGHRTVVAFHDHLRNEVHMHQEQITRTGLLLNRRFPLEEGVLIEQIPHVDPIHESTRTLARTGREFGGDWFHNRSMQGHWLRGTTSSRARLTLRVEGEDARLHSSFPDLLDQVFVRDAEGGFWLCENLRPGETVSLRPTTRAALRAWLMVETEYASPSFRTEIERLFDMLEKHPTEGFFLASTATPESFVYPTLPSIDWQKSPVLHFGHLSP